MPIFNRKKTEQSANEEQMQRRQSAPQPTAQEEAQRLSEQQAMSMPMADAQGTMDGFSVLSERIGKEEIHKAQLTLNKYKEGKANLEKKIVENEQWYKLRHWECMRGKTKEEVEPTSAWLFNCIANKHADAMDNFPAPNILPREEGDKGEIGRASCRERV